jgi:integrase
MRLLSALTNQKAARHRRARVQRRLRIREVCKLRVEDIDAKRMLIHVRVSGKVPISDCRR